MYTGDMCFYIFIVEKVRILRNVKCEMFSKVLKQREKSVCRNVNLLSYRRLKFELGGTKEIDKNFNDCL